MVKIYTRFQIKTAQKPFGAAHTYIAYIGEYPSPPPRHFLRTFTDFYTRRSNKSVVLTNPVSLCVALISFILRF